MKIRAVFNPLIVIPLLVLLVLWAGWRLLPSHFASKDLCNVLLISIDTCRADYLGCYGSSLQATPNIDSFAREGFLFSNAYSPVPITLPAHSSMLTGTIPPYHGVRDNNDYKLAESNETLAEILRSNGYTTAAVIGAFVMHCKFGLQQGFEYYNSNFEKSRSSIGINERRAEEVNHFAIEWLEKNKNKRFFLFLHYFDPHAVYEPPEPFASKFKENPYAGEIAYTDHCIGQVLRKLKEEGLYESTLIIITSDHGEMLGEHGAVSHAYFIYQSALRVPLIFRIPDQENGKRIDAPVGLIDIVPTVCGTLGIEVPDQAQGEDLSRYFKKNHIPVKDRRLYCESLTPTKYGASPLLGVVTDRWKYIHTVRPELYDIIEDPGEAVNLIKQQPEMVWALQDHLRKTVESSARNEKSGTRITLDQEDISRLESLGYVASARVRDDFEFDQSKEDPKDLLGVHNQLMSAFYFAFHMKDYKEAKTICERLLKERPRHIETYALLTKIALRQDDLTGALEYMTKLIRLIPQQTDPLRIKPNLAAVHIKMGTALKRQGKINEAVDSFLKASRINPDMSEAYFELGVIFHNQRKTNEAINNFSKALKINPDMPEAHYNLGVIFLEQGKTDDAIKKFFKALQINPDYVEAHNNLGLAFHRKGKIKEALNHYNESLRIDPDQPMVHNNAGAALQDQGKIDAAIKCFSTALQIDPDFEKAHNNIGIALLKKGKTKDAIAHFRAALRINPDYTIARENLKATLAKKSSY